MFTLEKEETITLATRKTTLSTYKHGEFRIIFVEIPGPLVSCSIVIPTLCKDNKGLPHTLEHLIFCGSLNHPHRGFLDNLAVRCCSTGTNAYTSEDHTCYELTTAGEEGMIECFPVFLDHVFNPTLTESQFITEVHGIDGDGKHQGVVYCEMAARENTEADLLDQALRELVYQEQTTYSKECGGSTKEIANLKNSEIIAYHREFYNLYKSAVIFCGQIDPSKVFEKLSKNCSLLSNSQLSVRNNFPGFSIHQPALSTKIRSRTVHFPSEDEAVGSIAYAWQGPASEDIKTIFALEVLFRYLNDNPSSPIAQAFTEVASPLASDVDLDIRATLLL
jgi:Zn-dependent M16 (insulinase) family peptidase